MTGRMASVAANLEFFSLYYDMTEDTNALPNQWAEHLSISNPAWIGGLDVLPCPREVAGNITKKHYLRDREQLFPWLSDRNDQFLFASPLRVTPIRNEPSRC
jgi:hypothetical protein